MKPDGKRRQITKTFRGLGEARAFVAESRASIRRGTFIAADSETFDALALRWLDSRREIREISRNGYANVLQAVRGKLGHRRVQDLRRSDFEGLVSWLGSEGGQRGRGLSQRSIVFTMGAVRQVLGYAVAEGLIAANPAVGVKAPRKQRGDTREVQVWEPAELLRFRAVADADDWAAGWRLSLCGLRRSEVLGMRWGAVDLSTGMVRVEAGRVALVGHRVATDFPKSAASWRTVPAESVHPGTVAIFRGLSARQAARRRYGIRTVQLRDRECSGTSGTPRAVLCPLCPAVPSGRRSGGPAALCAAHACPDDAPGRAGTGGCFGVVGPLDGRAPGQLRPEDRAGRADCGISARPGARR
jgi:site-specific recombinase XerC